MERVEHGHASLEGKVGSCPAKLRESWDGGNPVAGRDTQAVPHYRRTGCPPYRLSG